MRELGPQAIGAYAALRSQIVAGEWPAGTRLPNQAALASILHVAPLTLRQALDRLEAEGMISRQSRRGTFVQRASAVAIPRLNEMFDLMFEHAPMGISVVDSVGCLVRCNVALENLLGYSASELSGKFVRDFSYPDDLEHQNRVISDSIKDRRQSFQLEKRYIRSDGEVIWCRLTVYSLTHQGEDAGAVSMIERISSPHSDE
jgi:PAS domain S-box-containing protein